MLWLLLAAGGVVLLWWRRVRRARDTWLHDLNLIGKWELEADASAGESEQEAPAKPKRTLNFSGSLARGSYVARDGDAVERGEWRLSGNTLTLVATEGEVESKAPQRYELRLFKVGKIGIDGAGREREIYLKRDGNVIPLARRPKRRG